VIAIERPFALVLEKCDGRSVIYGLFSSKGDAQAIADALQRIGPIQYSIEATRADMVAGASYRPPPRCPRCRNQMKRKADVVRCLNIHCDNFDRPHIERLNP
jgi:hypothetical protein